MGTKTNIQWTDSTWNPWHGCIKVSPGCKNCYMYRDKGGRFGQDPMKVVRSKPPTFQGPLKKKGFGPLVFTCSWSDFFIEQADGWRDDAWDIIRKTPHLTYQILTKRPQNIKDRLPDDWGEGWPNVWFGVSIESSDQLWRIVPFEDDVPAKVVFVSYEPALEYVDFSPFFQTIDWLISGGESGPGARVANADWLRAVRDDCIKGDIPFFHKQNGGTGKVNGHWGGRELDGQEWNQMPKPKPIRGFEAMDFYARSQKHNGLHWYNY